MTRRAAIVVTAAAFVVVFLLMFLLVVALEPDSTCVEPAREQYVRDGYGMEEARWLAQQDCE